MIEFGFGALGFAGYEALRLYRRIQESRPILEKVGALSYIAVVGVMGIVVTLFAGHFSAGDTWKAFFVGFCGPSGLASVARSFAPGPHVVEFDDIEVTEEGSEQASPSPQAAKTNSGNRLLRAVQEFFLT